MPCDHQIKWTMVLVTQRFERYSCSCSKVFCCTVYKISTIYLAYAENRTRSTVKQHDQSLRQVTLSSFVVLKKAADNFCGCNKNQQYRHIIFSHTSLNISAIIYHQVPVCASNTTTLAKLTKH